jgi:hypothetical protein
MRLGRGTGVVVVVDEKIFSLVRSRRRTRDDDEKFLTTCFIFIKHVLFFEQTDVRVSVLIGLVGRGFCTVGDFFK